MKTLCALYILAALVGCALALDTVSIAYFIANRDSGKLSHPVVVRR